MIDRYAEATMVSQPSSRVTTANMQVPGQEVIRFQPWVTLETAAGGPDPLEVVQPASQWLAGAHVGTYYLRAQVAYLSDCTLYLESSITPEGPWETVTSFTANADQMVVITSEGGDSTFSGYVRWRVSGTAPWQVCFQFKATPGASVSEAIGTPKRV